MEDIRFGNVFKVFVLYKRLFPDMNFGYYSIHEGRPYGTMPYHAESGLEENPASILVAYTREE